MSVLTVLTALAARLTQVNPAPQPPPTRIYAHPAEAVSVMDVPIIVLAQAPNTEQQMTLTTHQHLLHAWVAVIYVIVGARDTGLPELHERVLPWAEAITKVLVRDPTLGGMLVRMGSGEQFVRYSIGAIEWGDGLYFAVTMRVPVVERMED